MKTTTYSLLIFLIFGIVLFCSCSCCFCVVFVHVCFSERVPTNTRRASPRARAAAPRANEQRQNFLVGCREIRQMWRAPTTTRMIPC